MSSIKSYTDLKQSKILTEILPPESADMHYVLIDTDKNKYSAGLGKYIGILPHYPCWSLAALLDVLPLGVEKHRQADGDKICYYVELYMKHDGKEIYLSTDRHKRLVDACYEMILKLHKLKLL